MALDLDRQIIMDAEQLEWGMRWLSQDGPARTICNVIRQISLTAKNRDVTVLCCEAIVAAKAMDEKLRHYKSQWDKGLWVPESVPHARS